MQYSVYWSELCDIAITCANSAYFFPGGGWGPRDNWGFFWGGGGSEPIFDELINLNFPGVRIQTSDPPRDLRNMRDNKSIAWLSMEK